MLTGCDISSYQSAIPPGQDFVVFKATEGLTINDSRFSGWWDAALGKLRGAYHFGHPSNSAVAEADHFLSVVAGRLAPGDLVVLDHEVNDGMSAAHCAQWAQDWCARVKQKTGITPIVYTFLSFAWDGNCAGLGGYPLWIADPSSAAGHPRVPAPWKTWVLHQYSETGGIDHDVFNGIAADWRVLGGQQQEEDMAAVSSVGAAGGQQVPASNDVSIQFSKVYSDKHGFVSPGSDGKAYSVYPDGPYWAVCDAVLELHGFKPGDAVDVAWSRMKSDGKGGWTVGDDAWRSTFYANSKGVVRALLNGQFGIDKPDPVRLRVYNPNNYPLTVQGCMAKLACLKY